MFYGGYPSFVYQFKVSCKTQHQSLRCTESSPSSHLIPAFTYWMTANETYFLVSHRVCEAEAALGNGPCLTFADLNLIKGS